MVINGKALIEADPVFPLYLSKETRLGVSFGLGEAGYDIRIKQNVLLHPLQRFKLASTIEQFHMPRDLMAIVHDKSTWARRGLSVFNTVIEPGWEGYLTLELVYHRMRPLFIPAGSGIAQVVFHKLAHEAAYSGKYQNQENKPVKAIKSNNSWENR